MGSPSNHPDLILCADPGGGRHRLISWHLDGSAAKARNCGSHFSELVNDSALNSRRPSGASQNGTVPSFSCSVSHPRPEWSYSVK